MQKSKKDYPPSLNAKPIITTRKRLKLKRIKKLKKIKNKIIHELDKKSKIINISNKPLNNENDKSPFKINLFEITEKLTNKNENNVLNNLNQFNEEQNAYKKYYDFILFQFKNNLNLLHKFH